MIELLLVEDCPLDAAATRRALRGTGIELTVATTLAEARQRLTGGSIDIILVDYKLPDGVGLELLPYTRGRPVVLVTGGGNEGLAVAALKAGAADYIVKDTLGAYLKLLPTTIDTALEAWRVKQELQRTHAALQSQLERTRRINRELKAFASRVSHDVRAPLRRIRTFIDIIVQEGPAVPGGISSMFDILVRQVDELDATTKRLLEFSKAGGDIDGCPLAPRDLIEVATQRLSIELQESGGSVVVDDLPASIYGDACLIELVLQNLTANAIKFRAEQPPVISFSGHTDASGASILRVRDNGRGVRADEADRLFDPFYRGHHEQETLGSGIGLSTCRRIIEAHGGWIRFTAVEGPGACVELCLPPAPRKAAHDLQQEP